MIELKELIAVAKLVGIDLSKARVDGYTMDRNNDDDDIIESNVVQIYDDYKLIRFSSFTYHEALISYYEDAVPHYGRWLLKDRVIYSRFIFIMKENHVFYPDCVFGGINASS